MLPLLLSFLFFTAAQCWGTVAVDPDYREQLILRPLPQSSLLASFNFRSNETSRAFSEQNFRFFPRALGQILQYAHAKELHMRFSLGRWDAATWGDRPWAGAREGGTGVELWAWVEAESEEEANARWLTLTNTLSGLFCASLNFIDSTKTIRPVMSFEPEGHHRNMSRLHLLHGTLPHEVVCTENLTPFLKLLPCKGKAGISSLLDGHKLFDASWQTMAIDVRPLCSDKADCIVEIEQTVDMVLDIERSKRPRDNPIPRPRKAEDLVCDESKPYHRNGDSCFPLDTGIEPEWNVTEVFGHAIRGSCPLVPDKGQDSETVCVDVPPERIAQPRSAGKFVESRRKDGFLRCFKLPPKEDFDINFERQELKVKMPPKPAQLYATRFITGHGQERGGIEATLTNQSPDRAVDVVYLESIPWFMKPYLHTLRAQVTSLSGGKTDHKSPIRDTYYRPAVDRHRGSHLELVLTIPAMSIVTLTYDFEKAILRYTEYPPDANRGFDAPPAVVRILPSSKSSPGSESHKGAYLRTTSLLLYLPTPDFSMPYNVIILTSTVIALGFGNIFNLLVRRFVGANEVDGWQLASIRTIVIGKLMSIKARFAEKGAKVQ